MKFVLSFLIFSSISFPVAAQEVAVNPDCVSRISKLKIEIKGLSSLGLAMTKGTLLRGQQADLFDIYLRSYFGDPSYSTKLASNDQFAPDKVANLHTVDRILKQYPDLEKKHFREYEIKYLQKVYTSSESLSKFISSQSSSAGQVRSNLFQVEANLGFWKKVLDYQDAPAPEGLDKQQQKEFQTKVRDKFKKYLTSFLVVKHKDLVQVLMDSKQDYKIKIVKLFETLNYIKDWMEKRGRNTQAIRQAMVDLVHTAGFSNQETQSLLKSKNPSERIEGFKKILSEKDILAEELGFEGHFDELLTSLKIDFPTGSNKSEKYGETLNTLEKEITQGPSTTLPSEVLRVRSLSIQEAPFRSCLAGDCATRTYFGKALDPNFNYFTLTDENHQSSGQVTVVLGVATDPQGQKEIKKIAFVDKIQNVPNQVLPLMLEAIRLSLAEKKYTLVLSESVGDGHSGLSNDGTTRHFVDKEILPKLSRRLENFKANPNEYDFKNAWSQAYSEPNVRVLEPIKLDALTSISPGDIYKPRTAPKDLDKNKLVTEIQELRNSNKEEDTIKYIEMGAAIKKLEKLGLMPVGQYEKNLREILGAENSLYNVKKRALLQISESEKNIDLTLLQKFSDAQIKQLSGEIATWEKSNSPYKANFYKKLQKGLLTVSNVEELHEFLRLGVKMPDNGIDLFNHFLKTKNQEGVLLSLENGVNPNIKMTDERSLLNVAIQEDWQQVIEYLLTREDLYPSQEKYSSLALAAKKQNWDLVKILVRKNERAFLDGTWIYDDAHQKPGEFTALVYAFESGDIETVKFLIENAASPFVVEGYYGYSLIYAAIAKSKWDMANILIKSPMVGPILTAGKSANECIVWAAMNKHWNIVKYLIDRGADPDARDGYRGSLFEIAQKQNNIEMLRYVNYKSRSLRNPPPAICKNCGRYHQ